MCDNCDHNNNDSGFIFGMIIGAIIGAFVAIYFYKNNKTKVFANLRAKLQSYFGITSQKQSGASRKSKPKAAVKKESTLEKIPVILPHAVTKEVEPAKPLAAKPAKMFKK